MSAGFTWRSLLLGTVAVVAVCALTPYNDYVLSDTSLVSGAFPLALVLILFLLIVGINAPLHRFAPKRALSTGELAVITLMTLVACSLPNWGLMRFLIPMPVNPFHLGAADPPFWKAFLRLDLPGWLFPVETIEDGRNSDVVKWFFFRVPAGEHIPWRAWIVPLLAWGVFAAAMLATLAAMARLVFEQWAANERLPFPLVQVQAALIEPPRPGNALNDLFRSHALWIGLLGVFFIHSLTALNGYQPRYFPKFSVGYNLTNILADPPWFYLDAKVKKAAISFMVVGVTYFIRARVAFSLWTIFLLCNIVQVQQHGEIPPAAWQDQHLGAAVAFILGMLWIGRHHWGRVLRNAFRASTDRTYRASFWIVVVGVIVMLSWLRIVGVQFRMGIIIVAIILAAHVIVSRVLAETGLPFYRSNMSAAQVYTNLPMTWFGGRDVLFAQIFTVLGPQTTRDSLMSFTTSGMGVAKEAGIGETERRKVGGVIAWALCIGFVVAAAATLWCQYSYPTPTMAEAVPARNYFGAEYVPRRDIANPFDSFSAGKFTPAAHSPARHFGIGFGATVLLEICSLRWANWPLLPVGFVTSYGAFIGNAWFSIFAGWLTKVLIVRFGGSRLFQRTRPLFIGLIFGEALAAGFWLIVNAVVVWNGGNSQAIKFLL